MQARHDMPSLLPDSLISLFPLFGVSCRDNFLVVVVEEFRILRYDVLEQPISLFPRPFCWLDHVKPICFPEIAQQTILSALRLLRGSHRGRSSRGLCSPFGGGGTSDLLRRMGGLSCI